MAVERQPDQRIAYDLADWPGGIYAQSFDRDSNTVEVFIARLRRKLGPSFIETVRGLGYRIKATP